MKRLHIFPIAALLLISTIAWSASGEQDDLAQDRKHMQGTWSVVAYDQDGKALPDEIIKSMSVTLQADRITIRPKVIAQRMTTLKDGKAQDDVKFTVDPGKADEAKYRLAFTKKRKVIELTQDIGSGQTRKITGGYLLEHDTLTILLPLPDRKLPKMMPTAPKAGLVRLVLKKTMASKTAAVP